MHALQKFKPRSLLTPTVTWFVRHDGSVQRVRAVRCAQNGAALPPATRADRRMPVPAEAGTGAACPSGEDERPQHSTATAAAERDPLAGCHPASPRPQPDGAGGDGAGREVVGETPEDAAEVRRLRRLGWRLEEADACSDQSMRAICTYSALGNCGGCGADDLASRERSLEAQVSAHASVLTGAVSGTRHNAGTLIIISDLRKV